MNVQSLGRWLAVILIASLVLLPLGLQPQIAKAQTINVDHIRLPGIGYAVVTEACPPGTPNWGNGFHDGSAAYAVDFSGANGFPVGTPVYAPASGEVVFASTGWNDGYGNLVRIRDNQELTHWLAHLAKIYVQSGQSVSQGQLIGLSGGSGNGDPHLHWHVHNVNNVAVNLTNVDGMNVDCDIPDGANPGSATGPALPSNPYNSCSEYSAAFQNDPHIALFDHADCQGNVLRLSWSTSNAVRFYLNGSAGFNDRTRSIYIPSGWSVTLGANVWDEPIELTKCLSATQTNLDNVKYDENNSIPVGYNPEPAHQNGYDMASYAVASKQSTCVLAANAVSSYELQIGSPNGNPAWLKDFAKAENKPFEVVIHTKVDDTASVYDAHRVLVDGNTLYDTISSEYYHTWNTYGVPDGEHTLTVQYRRQSDGGSWANALSHEETFYLSPNRSFYAPCSSSVNGAKLVSGSNCIKVTSSVADLANAGWADRYGLTITATGVDVLAYDASDFGGPPYYIRDGQTVSVGNNVSGIELREPLGTSAYIPTQPLGTDGNTLAYLPMDEGSGTQVFDAVGSLDGTLAGSASFATGKFGQAIAGSSSPVGGVNFGAVNLGSPWTIELFVKFNSVSGDQRVAAQLGGGSNTGNNKWQIRVTSGRFNVWLCYVHGCHDGHSLENVEANKWYYLMLTYDGSTTGKFYVNSIYQDTIHMDGTLSSGSTTFEIGKGENVDGCDCLIDDVRISTIVREPTMPGPWNGGLVSNGSFEALTSGWANNWTRNSTNSVVVDTGSNGTHGSNSLRFLSDTVNHHAFSDEMSVSSINSYIWLTDVRSTSGTGEFGFYIDEYDSGHNWISGQWHSALQASAQGTKIIRYTPSSTNVAYASLQYYMNADTSYEVFVDSVSFVQASNNMVTNGGFEYLLNGWADGWTRDNTSLVTINTSSQGNEGANSLHFASTSSNTHAFAPRIPVGSGAYTWSQNVVSTAGSGEFGFYIDEYDANGDWISGQWKGAVYGAGSGTQSFTYTRSSSNVAYAVPQFYMTAETTFDVYVDSVSFTPQ